MDGWVGGLRDCYVQFKNVENAVVKYLQILVSKVTLKFQLFLSIAFFLLTIALFCDLN